MQICTGGGQSSSQSDCFCYVSIVFVACFFYPGEVKRVHMLFSGYALLDIYMFVLLHLRAPQLNPISSAVLYETASEQWSY